MHHYFRLFISLLLIKYSDSQGIPNLFPNGNPFADIFAQLSNPNWLSQQNLLNFPQSPNNNSPRQQPIIPVNNAWIPPQFSQNRGAQGQPWNNAQPPPPLPAPAPAPWPAQSWTPNPRGSLEVPTPALPAQVPVPPPQAQARAPQPALVEKPVIFTTTPSTVPQAQQVTPGEIIPIVKKSWNLPEIIAKEELILEGGEKVLAPFDPNIPTLAPPRETQKATPAPVRTTTTEILFVMQSLDPEPVFLASSDIEVNV